MNFTLKAPCANCPFRNDRPDQKGWLGRARATEIAEAITDNQQTFSCHKTLHNKEQQHCAGALILLEKLKLPNQMMRIMERIGYYDHKALKMASPVFDTAEEFIDSHVDHRG